MDDYVRNIWLPRLNWAGWAFVAGVAGYMVALYLSYVYAISPHFAYLGFIYQPDGWHVIALAGGLALIPAVWMPVELKRPSQAIYVLLYLMVMIPTMLVGALAGILSMWRLGEIGILFVFVFAGLRLSYEAPLVDIPKIVRTNTAFWLIFGAIAVAFYGILFAKYGIYVQIPSLDEVYTQRQQFRQTITGLGAYVFFWVSKVVNPFLLAKGYVDRSAILFGLGLLGQLLLFAMSGLKAVLLSFLLLGAFLVALGRNGRFFGLWVVWGFVVLIASVAIVDAYLGLNIASSLFVRRLLLVPGLNTSYYLDFFSTNPHVFLGHSVLSWAVDYPYGARPAMVIGNAYFGHVDIPIDMSANANLWADAYANFGNLGILFFSALLAALFWLIDSLSRQSEFRLAVLLLAFPAYNLVDTKLQTSLLTHGIWLVLVILYLLPRQEDASDDE